LVAQVSHVLQNDRPIIFWSALRTGRHRRVAIGRSGVLGDGSRAWPVAACAANIDNSISSICRRIPQY
jgi:hypothetical protein